MKKFRFLLLLVLVVCISASFVACNKIVKFKIDFVVDEQIYQTMNTVGNEVIQMPENPTKDGYVFNGWYWDKNVWQKPFTANSLLDAPLSCNMSVYAKWQAIQCYNGHTKGQSVKENEIAATCVKDGSYDEVYYCTVCGDEVERNKNIVTKTGHKKGTAVIENEIAATCVKDGSYDEVLYCLVCEEEIGRTHKVIEKLGHDLIHHDAKAPDYENIGWTEYDTCSRCDYSTYTELTKLTDKRGATIIGAKNMTVDNINRTCSIALPYATTTFSLINEFTLSPYAKWVLSSDIYGMNTIVTKTVPLDAGNNVYYALVTSGDEETINLYTITIRRRPIYTVNFVTNGGTSVDSQKIEETHFATEPTTTRAGYTFVKWSYDFTQPIMGNQTVSASWQANTDTAYKVEYYLQNLEDDNYTLIATDNLSGTTDTTANAVIKSFEHFTYNAERSTISGNINANGNLVLKVYYTRDKYDYSVINDNKKAGTITYTANGNYKYDTPISLSATVNASYDFVGWFDGENKISDKLNYEFNLTKNISITAKWFIHTDTAYKTEYYLQNLADDNYTLTATDNLSGTTDTTANAEIKSFKHFTYNAEKSTISGNIDGNGNLVLKVYYTRDSYNYFVATENEKAGTINCTANGKYKYDTTISLSATVNAGYDFFGWFDGENKVSDKLNYEFNLTENTTIIAKWYIHTDTVYKTEYYLQNLEDDNYTLTATDNLSGTTDTTANAVIKSFEHFTYNSTKSTISGNIDGNGNLVLKVYYTRDTYTVSVSAGNNVSVTNAISGAYKYGYEYAGSVATFNNYLAYEWDGWYVDGIKTNDNFELDAFIVTSNIAIAAQSKIKEEMQNFNFTSTATTCIINGVKDKTITNITIPDYVTGIGNSAFANCDNLQYNTYDNAKYLGNSSNPYFVLIKATNTSITTCIINKNTKIIGDNAFLGCINLSRIDIPEENTAYSSKDGIIYNKKQTELVYVPKNIQGAITISNGVTSISSNSFNGCSGLTDITLPDSIIWIGEGAFAGCSGLIEMTLPFIGDTAGTNTGTLHYPFGYIFGTSIFNGSIRAAQLYYDHYYIVYIPRTLKKVTITNSNIPNYAFYNCSSITNVVIGNHITTIGEDAFYMCSGLSDITIGSSVSTIKDNAFIGNKLQNINYTGDIAKWCGIKGVDNIMSRLSNPFALYINGNKVENELVIPNDVTNINDYAFSGCSGLTSITIPDSVTRIGNGAFASCSGLTSVTIPDSVTRIGAWAFNSCSGLTSVTIGSSVTSIGYEAFRGCSGLTSITIPDSVTSIGESAFYNCSGLTSVTIGSGVTSIGWGAFNSCRGLTTVNWNATACTSASDDRHPIFDGCTKLSTVNIGNNVTTIPSYAFYNCSGLTSINYSGTKEQWRAISKGYKWNMNTPNYVIYCTDGTMT